MIAADDALRPDRSEREAGPCRRDDLRRGLLHVPGLTADLARPPVLLGVDPSLKGAISPIKQHDASIFGIVPR